MRRVAGRIKFQASEMISLPSYRREQNRSQIVKRPVDGSSTRTGHLKP